MFVWRAVIGNEARMGLFGVDARGFGQVLRELAKVGALLGC